MNSKNEKEREVILILSALLIVIFLSLILFCSYFKYNKEHTKFINVIKYFEVPVQEYSYYFDDEKIVITNSNEDERVYNLKYNISSCINTILSNIPGVYTATGLSSKVYITKSKAVEWEELDSKIIEVLTTKGCEDEEKINEYFEYFEHFDSFIIDDSMYKNNI